MKKVSLNKVTELINNQVSNSLKEVKASKTQKPKETKESKAKEEPKAKLVKTTTKKASTKKEEPKAKLVKTTTKKASTKKEEVVKEVAKQQKPNIIEQVISNREVKYIYPDDVTDTLSRKKWRQQTRNELRKLEREMLRIQDHNSKEYKSAKNKYITFQKKVLKVDEAV
jgi:flagellar biosynthesis GTPase FlhF